MRNQKGRKKRLFRLITLLICLTLLIVIARQFLLHDTNKIVLSEKTKESSPTPTPTPTIVNSPQLQSVVLDALSGTKGSYGIYIKNLETQETFASNQNTLFQAASLYKLWIMALVYERIQQGTLHESDKLSKSVKDLNKEFSIDPTLAEKKEGTISYSVKDALYEMVTISDNYAALLLTDKIGITNVIAFLHSNGFASSQVGLHGKQPVTTPADVALFFEKLYKGELANSTITSNMIDLLKQQRLNSKIPSLLPYTISVAHKTGELDEYSHDGGIIFTPSGNYILVVLSKSDNPDLADQRIANISEAVYSYFTTSSSTSSDQ